MSYHRFADTNPILYHQGAIKALQGRVRLMDKRIVTHISQGADGRLNVDDTEHMIYVTKAQIKTHEECLALERHYAGEPLESATENLCHEYRTSKRTCSFHPEQ